MLRVDAFVSLDKILVTEELWLNKTKQVNPWSINIRAANCHCVSVVAKRTRIPCCSALHYVSYTPQKHQSPHSSEFALEALLCQQLLNFIIKVSSIIASIKSFLTKYKLRDLSCRFVVREEVKHICTFHKHKSTCKVQGVLWTMAFLVGWTLLALDSFSHPFTFRLHWSFCKWQYYNTQFFPQMLVCLV